LKRLIILALAALGCAAVFAFPAGAVEGDASPACADIVAGGAAYDNTTTPSTLRVFTEYRAIACGPQALLVFDESTSSTPFIVASQHPNGTNRIEWNVSLAADDDGLVCVVVQNRVDRAPDSSCVEVAPDLPPGLPFN
jgi:hypothetical protein